MPNNRCSPYMLNMLDKFGSTVGSLWPSSSKLPYYFEYLDSELLEIRQLEESYSGVSNEQLKAEFEDLRQKARTNELRPTKNRAELITAAAIGASAVTRVMGFRLHDVQLKGAIATASGAIIEMQTGEGKTVVCGLAALIRSVFDLAVHVATTNAYLAQRDHETVRPIFDLLGTNSNFIGPETDPQQAHTAYRCDITYAPGYVFGFDYLRDQLTLREYEELTLGRDVLQSIHGRDVSDRLTQTVHQTIIVDEADSVLIDESTTPLLLSGPSTDNDVCLEAYSRALDAASKLAEETDYRCDTKQRQIELTDSGLEKIHQNLREFGRMNLVQPWPTYVENAIYAEQLLVKDENYVVADDKIKLVDQNTGRIFEDRSLRAGLHQALEAKEGVTINPPNVTLARITRQSFFQLYSCVCGMTGTASGSESELDYFYDSPVIALPPNRPNKRIELPDRFFKDAESKLAAIVADISKRKLSQQPILVGTRTIRESLQVETALQDVGIECVVLNGIQDNEEADIIAVAGQPGSICIATNMAGRGTDIKLTPQSREAGGLHVVCTQRYESRRVDRQLAGRSARQGDPGSCQFFISADDPLLDDNDAALAGRIVRTADDAGECCTDFSDEILRLQHSIEKRDFQRRRKLVLQDSWMDQVRDTMARS